MRRAAIVLPIAVLAAGCVLNEPVLTPTAVPSASAPIAASASPSEPVESAPPMASASPGLAQVPRFASGSQATTNAPGLRVRSRPGTEQRTITSLGVDADLLVGMGPVMVDGWGWYLVRDADADEPAFGEGWVAAGFEPDPFLIPASFQVADNPYLGGYAHDGSGEYGPVILPGAGLTLRWIAAPTDADGCSFSLDLRPGGGEAVPAVRATVGAFAAPGELFSDYFAAHPELAADVFALVTSDCSWAFSFVRTPTASPSPAGT